MDIITENELVQQLKIDSFQEESSILTLYGDAAENSVLIATNRTKDELIAENNRRFGKNEFPATLKVAILMTAANLYRNRESGSGVNQVITPYGYDYLVKPWIKL